MLKLVQAYLYENFYNSKDINIYTFYRYFFNKTNSTLKYNLDLETLFFEFKNKVINE